jgi:predicted nucleotidyltransferase
MELSEQQADVICQWASDERCVETVRLFGSYAKGTARADSDLDLAITVSGSRALTPEGNYLFSAERWEKALRHALGIRVKIHSYNVPAENNPVRAFCDEFSKVLYERARDGGGDDLPGAGNAGRERQKRWHRQKGY